jgi:uncharacterized protein DUF6934
LHFAFRIQYFFLSKGTSIIIKAIQYSYALDFQGRRVYNLGFGDYDPNTRSVIDDVTSNNGDTYKIFHTVLNTIPGFFAIFKEAVVIASGSDSRQEFRDSCRSSCNKNCLPDQCKNAHRRINIYRHYIDKHFAGLSTDYQFYGSSLITENQIVAEEYNKERPYIYLLTRRLF